MTLDRAFTVLAETQAAVLMDGNRMEDKKRNYLDALKVAIDVIHEKRTALSCKDCKYFFQEIGGEYGSCTRIQGGDVVKETDFCSRAKEKQDDISDIIDNAAHTSSGLLEE